MRELFSDKIKDFMDEYYKIEDLHFSFPDSNLVNVQFNAVHQYQDISLPFQIHCEPTMESFRDNFNEVLDGFDVNDVTIDLIRNHNYDGYVKETYDGVQEIYDDLQDIYEDLVYAVEHSREELDEERLYDAARELAIYRLNDCGDRVYFVDDTPDFITCKNYLKNYADGFYHDTLTPEEFEKVNEIIDKFPKEFKLYDGKIELSDNHTIWDIEGDFDMGEYFGTVADAVEEFEEITGEELHLLGRNGRHVCVDFTTENMLNYEYLCETQKDLEQGVIDEMSIEHGRDDEER